MTLDGKKKARVLAFPMLDILIWGLVLGAVLGASIDAIGGLNLGMPSDFSAGREFMAAFLVAGVVKGVVFGLLVSIAVIIPLAIKSHGAVSFVAGWRCLILVFGSAIGGGVVGLILGLFTKGFCFPAGNVGVALIATGASLGFYATGVGAAVVACLLICYDWDQLSDLEPEPKKLSDKEQL